MKVKKEIDLTALQLAIFGLSATKAKAVLAAVGVRKSDLEGLESVQNLSIELPQVYPDWYLLISFYISSLLI